jgi:hypothetical protein
LPADAGETQYSNYRTPADWRKVLGEHRMANSETAWRKFRDDYLAEKHLTMRCYRFSLSELGRAGIKVPEAATSR